MKGVDPSGLPVQVRVMLDQVRLFDSIMTQKSGMVPRALPQRSLMKKGGSSRRNLYDF